MSWREQKTTYGAIAAFLIAAWPAWGWLDANVFMTEAQGAEIVRAVNQFELRRARDQIARYETLAVETKYRTDLSDQQKDELITIYARNIAVWKQIESCLLEGKIDC